MPKDNQPPNSSAISAEILIELLQIAYNLAEHVSSGAENVEMNISPQTKEMLHVLLDYLILNEGTENIDPKILAFLEKFLGISKKRKKLIKKEKEEQQEEEISLEERKEQERFVQYEIYKIINPHQIAGETALENYKNNLMARGEKEALKYSGSEYSSKVSDKEKENLGNVKPSFVQKITKMGVKGSGLGI